MLLLFTVGVACGGGDERLERVRSSSTSVSYLPPGAVLVREGTMRGDGGPLGQQAVPTVLRTFEHR